jgi:hypothetical protein
MPNLERTGSEIAGSGAFEERFSMLVAHIGPEKPITSQIAAIEVLLGLAVEAPWLADRIHNFLATQHVNGEHTDHVTEELGRALAAL